MNNNIDNLIGTIEDAIKHADKRIAEMKADESNMKLVTKNAYGVITKDHIDSPGYSGKRLEFPIKLTDAITRKRFKLYDDDDDLYYEGYFFDDPYSEVQMDILDWAMNDSGCTKIMVSVGRGKFIQEIS